MIKHISNIFNASFKRIFFNFKFVIYKYIQFMDITRYLLPQFRSKLKLTFSHQNASARIFVLHMNMIKCFNQISFVHFCIFYI